MLADMKGLRGMFSEIKLVTLGVADLDRSSRSTPTPSGSRKSREPGVEALSSAWRIPAGIAGRFAIMGIPGVESGMLRLVEWTRGRPGLVASRAFPGPGRPRRHFPGERRECGLGHVEPRGSARQVEADLLGGRAERRPGTPWARTSTAH